MMTDGQFCLISLPYLTLVYEDKGEANSAASNLLFTCNFGGHAEG